MKFAGVFESHSHPINGGVEKVLEYNRFTRINAGRFSPEPLLRQARACIPNLIVKLQIAAGAVDIQQSHQYANCEFTIYWDYSI